MLFHFTHFLKVFSLLVVLCSFLTVTKTLIIASIMEDKLVDNKS